MDLYGTKQITGLAVTMCARQRAKVRARRNPQALARTVAPGAPTAATASARSSSCATSVSPDVGVNVNDGWPFQAEEPELRINRRRLSTFDSYGDG